MRIAIVVKSAGRLQRCVQNSRQDFRRARGSVTEMILARHTGRHLPLPERIARDTRGVDSKRETQGFRPRLTATGIGCGHKPITSNFRI